MHTVNTIYAKWMCAGFMKRSILALFCVASSLAIVSVRAQVVPAATSSTFHLSAGALGSLAQPDYNGIQATDSSNRIYGPGAFVDIHFSRWVQVEAEGRWLRIPTFIDSNENQSNYLIGPRVPIKQFGKFETYGKVLIGLARMTFPAQNPFNYTTGRFTDLAFGGTVDYKLNRRWSIRAIDFEYQDWPKFIPKDPTVANSPSTSLQPYGISVGVGYRIF